MVVDEAGLDREAWSSVVDENEVMHITSSPSDAGDFPSWSESVSPNCSYENCDMEVPRLPDRNEKHKLGERQRRDTTRNLVRQLQRILPNTTDNKENPNINVILENTLEFLQTDDKKAGSKVESKKAVHAKQTDIIRATNPASQIMSPFDDTAGRRYLFAFDYAPMGLVISSVEGKVLGANKSFQRWFRFDSGMDGSTIFSLTCAEDLAKTLKVASKLVAGDAPVIALTKQCVRGDGVKSELLYVEMSVIRKDDKPYAFLCEVRPADPCRFGLF